MKIAFFGSSLVSAYWNGAATYYRGIIRGLHSLGHRITFYEPAAFGRQEHRDIDDPYWADVVVYDPNEKEVRRAIKSARNSDVIVKASGVGVFDELLEEEILELKRPSNVVLFWDVDAPATLDRMMRDKHDPFRKLVPRFDAVFTYGGGEPVVRAYRSLGTRFCVPIYNALDTQTHYPVAADARFEAHAAFLGNRLPDRESRVDEFFLKPAAEMPDMKFLLGGAGWGDRPVSANVRYLDHVYTADHNAFNCTPRAILNISRDSMARYGYSPATRLFEAAGACACLITDWWEGIELFLEPGKEVLVARSGEEVVQHLSELTHHRARQIGLEAYRRVRSEHTYRQRAAQVETILLRALSARAVA